MGLKVEVHQVMWYWQIAGLIFKDSNYCPVNYKGGPVNYKGGWSFMQQPVHRTVWQERDQVTAQCLPRSTAAKPAQ